MPKQTRRTFLKNSSKTTAAAMAGVSGVDDLINKFSPPVKPTSEGKNGNNSKSAGSVINLPEGGGSVKGIGETFQANPFTGTGNFSVPIYTSPGRGGFGPELSLGYSTGGGNGIFGMGWGLSVPKVSRKTEKGVPKYDDTEDVFVLSGAEDLVPFFNEIENENTNEISWEKRKLKNDFLNGIEYMRFQYLPRVEGLFARIEYWKAIPELELGATPPTQEAFLKARTRDSFWKITTKENITSIYGFSERSKCYEGKKVFEWCLEATYDAKGNCIIYQYEQDFAREYLASNVEIPTYEWERVQAQKERIAKNLEEKHYQTYLKKIHYGNIQQKELKGIIDDIHLLNAGDKSTEQQYIFTAALDYGEYGEKVDDKHQKITDEFYNNISTWNLRTLDSFSTYRAGFEMRTYRRCERVLMFHRTPKEDNPTALDNPVLVRSTDFHYDEDEKHSGVARMTRVTQRGYRESEAGITHYSEEKHLNDIDGVTYNTTYVQSDFYAIKSFPPIELTYSKFEPDQQVFKKMESEEDMPWSALSNPNYTVVDLFGTGLNDVLYTSPNGFYYWKNIGNGKFTGHRKLNKMPVGVQLEMAGVGFADHAGNGQADLVVREGAVQGYYEADGKGGWEEFRPYKNPPAFPLNSPSMRLLDIRGDGKSDAVFSDGVNPPFYFPCEGEEGYGEAVYFRKNGFPKAAFSSPHVKIADMTGDGLVDIVLVHKGSVEYYANLGNESFSPKPIRLELKNTDFDLGIDYDPNQVYLADIDGSGTADVIFVEFDKVHFWFNQSGNALSKRSTITDTPPVTNLDSIVLTDMMGTGSTGLLWSSDYVGRPKYMFLDFTGGTKPNLLIGMSNNMGSTTKVQYQPSTHFFLKDYEKDFRRRWITTLPFPVHVVWRVEKLDHISRTRLVTEYDYHHGYYDGKEREFRGFAFVEQRDTEFFNQLHEGEKDRNFQSEYNVPTVLTKTWFHTGAHEKGRMFDDLCKSADAKSNEVQLDLHSLFKKEYYAEGDHDFDLANSVLDSKGAGIDMPSLREAYRALRGQVLRQEVYAEDDSDKADKPYTITESNAKVVLVQPKGSNKHAVNFVHPHESLSYHFERKMDDPRVAQELTLQVDEYGNVLESVSIGYPRKGTGHEEAQMKLYATLTQNKFANTADEVAYYYRGIPFESQSFELHHLKREGDKLTADEIKDQLNGLGEDYKLFDFKLEKEETPYLYKRLLSWTKSFFKSEENEESAACIEIGKEEVKIDDTIFSCPKRTVACRLNLGQLSERLLPYESYQAVFSEAQIKSIFSDEDGDKFMTAADLDKRLICGGYINRLPNKPIKSDNGEEIITYETNHWWIPSGQQSFDAEKFCLPTKSCDPFGNISEIEYDGINLLMNSATDALGNVVKVETNDYVTLQPSFIIDPNGNGSKVAFDALGLVAASAVMGKTEWDESNKKWKLKPNEEGDLNNEFQVLWEYDSQFWQHIDDPYFIKELSNTDEGQQFANNYLEDATTAMLYDLWKYVREKLKDERNNEPPVVYSIAKEKHRFSREKENGVWKIKEIKNPTIQRQLMYFDGLGREVQTKIEAESEQGSTTPRWIESGWKIYNNKGKPVQQFEPQYTTDPSFSDNYEKAIEGKMGVSPTIFYDPLERVIVTIHPDGSFEKVEFDVWKQTTWDRNDTVCWNPGDAGKNPVIQKWREANPDFKTWKKRIEEEPTAAMDAALAQTLEHQDSLSIAHLDSLGRPFLTIAHNGAFESDPFKTRVALDIQGNDLHIIDPRDNQLFTHTFNMLQQQLVVDSRDAGKKWLLQAVDEQPIWSKDARGTNVVPEYDKLRRPLNSKVTFEGKTFTAVETTYDDPAIPNSIGQITQIKDQSGIIKNEVFDFKGNVKRITRQLWDDYKDNIDVSLSNIPILQKGKVTYTSTSEFDALNRVKWSQAPDDSIFKPEYNKTNQLKSLQVKLQGGDATIFVKNIDYNARGQRDRIQYGSGITTTYRYDEFTFRLNTLRSSKTDPNDNCTLQCLSYTYDPVGNITKIRDDAFDTIFNCNERIEPESNYTYDALYRLTKATGRQHVSYSGCEYMNKAKQTVLMNFRCELFQSTNDQKQLTTYTQYYQYDKAGNITEIKHCPNNNCARGWTRTQTYHAANNQILTTKTGSCYAGNREDEKIIHDPNGNIEKMPHLQNIEWDFANQMRKVKLNSGENHFAYYVYGSDGMRSRKVIVQGDEIYTQRLYLNGYEIFIDGQTEKTTLHIQDDSSRIALVETDTSDQKIKYQLTNHLGSATLETNDQGEHLSYEEYTPYGGSAFIASKPDSNNKATHAEQKRYRYSGKERDDETGLYYYGARYYAPWMGRWMKADPIGKGDGLNVFRFVRGNPMKFFDKSGYQHKKVEEPNSIVTSPKIDNTFENNPMEKTDYDLGSFSIGEELSLEEPEKLLPQSFFYSDEEIKETRRLESRDALEYEYQKWFYDIAVFTGIVDLGPAITGQGNLYGENVKLSSKERTSKTFTGLLGASTFYIGGGGGGLFLKSTKNLKGGHVMFYRSMSQAELNALRANRGLSHLKGKELFVSTRLKYSQKYLSKDGYDVLVKFKLKRGALRELRGRGVWHGTGAARKGWSSRGKLMWKKEKDTLTLGLQENAKFFNDFLSSFQVVK